MATYLAMIDLIDEHREREFPLETARIGILHEHHIYSYLPNTRSWVLNPSIERDYFGDRTELRYKTLPGELARYLASAMRPMNPLVVDVLLEDSRVLPKALLSDQQEIGETELLGVGDELIDWFRRNHVTLYRRWSGALEQASPESTTFEPAKLSVLARMLGSLAKPGTLRTRNALDRRIMRNEAALKRKALWGADSSIAEAEWATATERDRRYDFDAE
ncbi:hypothetical protein [Paenarthrobacter sp. YJN-5]|uniref:hypothetical protein n=1 Tax=Paenarthrobacter sp. YJN-5 TaxID=2735316 RepID=UPI00187763A9|nr:hypothetical protein [Paenarthrobacter sp. YJN-5]QOT15750.1 hypothetical protein HMI59_03530 [Paenarthrobacter sp. YJN-5]